VALVWARGLSASPSGRLGIGRRRHHHHPPDEIGPQTDDPVQLAGHDLEHGVAVLGLEGPETSVQQRGPFGERRGHLQQRSGRDDASVVDERMHFASPLIGDGLSPLTRDGRKDARPQPDTDIEVLHVRNLLSDRLPR
jgi:hypothetical protein